MQHMAEIFQRSDTETAMLVTAAIAIPGILLVFIQCAIAYTYGSVVATIAAVEDTTPGASLRSAAIAIVADEAETPIAPPPYSDDPDAKPADEAAPSAIRVVVTDDRPLTSSLRATTKHLRRRGGRLARFRGFGVALLWNFAAGAVTSIFSVNSMPVTGAIAFVVAQLLCLPLNLLWTHIVISEPSPRPWFRRFAGRAAYRKMALPTLAWALVQIAVPAIPAAIFQSSPARSVVDRDSDNPPEAYVSLVMIALTSLAMFALVWFPVTVMFVRCQAALLPETETPIVPFDRSFGGRVVPESEGGRGKLRMADAWRSLDRASRRRVVGVYLKTAALQFGTTMIFVLGWAALFAIWRVAAGGPN